MSQVDTSLFRPELVFFDFEATDEWDFFKKMSDTLKEKGYVRDSWHDAICAREKSFPTGLQFEKIGVAIPHPSTPSSSSTSACSRTPRTRWPSSRP